MNYRGIIIEESLADTSILKKVKIVGKRKEKVTERHQTPWLSQWTLDTVLVKESAIASIVDGISHSIDSSHDSSWYVDFKNDKFHYIIFPNKVFKVDLTNPVLYDVAEKYGTSLGIPSYQMGFKKLYRKLS